MTTRPGGTRRRTRSIRSKLAIVAGLLAGLTMITATVAGLGAWETARQVGRIEAAQARIGQLAAVSSSVSEFAIAAIGSATGEFSPSRASGQVDAAADRVRFAFARAGSVAQDTATTAGPKPETVVDARPLPQRLEQMQAIFEAIDTSIRNGFFQGEPSALSASLNSFSNEFSPQMAAAIQAEQARRNDAVRTIQTLRATFFWLAAGAIGATFALLVITNRRVARPLLSRIGLIDTATRQISSGDFSVDLPTEPADELGQLFRETNNMAQALATRQQAVARDRNQLGGIIRARTAELTAANTRLAAIDNSRRRFFADISHELRTPLTVILAEAELSRGGTPADMEASLEVIFNRAHKLNRRIDDLLRVARSESGNLVLDLERADLGEVAAAAIGDMTPLLQRKGIEAVLTTAEPCFVQIDRDWIRQVVASLLDNVAKHAAPAARVAIDVRRDGDLATLEVVDTGPGMSDAAIERAFDRFHNGPANRSSGGFGIGLSLARWVVTEHDGEISLSRAPQRGLNVSIRLPLAPD